MFHVHDKKIKELLFKGNFGLEKEGLRITREGFMAHTPHPFLNHKHIARDFCENQTEINTSVMTSAKEVINSLYQYTCEIQKKLSEVDELLWPFSNPPYIRNEKDIPIAKFLGEESFKTDYREYLSDRYGRYKMTFCGIHVNYSFSDELLEEDFKLSDETDFYEYKNKLYLSLAKRASIYSWILAATTASSPILDSSFVEKGILGNNAFNGMASTRCSELGYWNYFTPIFDYSSIETYADSIQAYVDSGLIKAPSELYYPVRLKPKGINNIEKLRNTGVNHIELRMFDLNPLVPAGIDERDLIFAQLLLIYLASTQEEEINDMHQVQAAQNFKLAAHYDLKTVKITLPNGDVSSVSSAGLKVIQSMKEFYKDYSQEIINILDYQQAKFTTPELRNSWILRKQLEEGYVKIGLDIAKKYQENCIKCVNC